MALNDGALEISLYSLSNASFKLTLSLEVVRGDWLSLLDGDWLSFLGGDRSFGCSAGGDTSGNCRFRRFILAVV